MSEVAPRERQQVEKCLSDAGQALCLISIVFHFESCLDTQPSKQLEERCKQLRCPLYLVVNGAVSDLMTPVYARLFGKAGSCMRG